MKSTTTNQEPVKRYPQHTATHSAQIWRISRDSGEQAHLRNNFQGLKEDQRLGLYWRLKSQQSKLPGRSNLGQKRVMILEFRVVGECRTLITFSELLQGLRSGLRSRGQGSGLRRKIRT